MKIRNKYLPRHTGYFKYGGKGRYSSQILRLILFDIFISNLGHGVQHFIELVVEAKWRGSEGPQHLI